ncbi:KTSC domain-containing protein [Sphingomonas sp. NSE70-1]|uniref:KTSC domain-containing protein n=1 Tax=Sphingomonas caseinilyticus TaxID=2908205 RepID=A0ABT0RVM0_9SPHN|nr:KTSC domain-containing protein [Sphingomonas caseinilyticus]MCL6699072.1 KTSC domain-containing protein [Sphingomonas caseinilyticus]
MPSTVIKRFDYWPDSQELVILFTTGRRYLYSEVSEEAVGEFRAAFSKGVHFNRYIRDRYPCTELGEPAPSTS